MVSTSGTRLLEGSAVSAIRENLFPLAQWITPNIPEAELLCSRKLTTPGDLAEAALQLYEEYQCNVILKSGHAIFSDKAADIVCKQGKIFTLTSPAAAISGNTAHGTGCTLSAALTANFARGRSWQEALTAAKAFVYGSLCESRYLSDRLSQMYPPGENYLNQVILEEK
jgi:hydroxymethylpyrimidine/phosphomethylpyrimidine kinase